MQTIMQTIHRNGIAIMDNTGTGGHFAFCDKRLNGTGDLTVEWDEAKRVTCADCIAKEARYAALDSFGRAYETANGSRNGLSAAYDQMAGATADEIYNAISLLTA